MKNNLNSAQSKKDWFRIKHYPHIGLKLEQSDRKWIEPFVKNKTAISKHAFYPFIHRQLNVRKFRREVCHDGTRSILRKPSQKTREIYYANHIDSLIYGYYSDLLSYNYEALLSNSDLSDCITAYRKIQLDNTDLNSRNKCNIDFANDIFNFIKNSKNKNLVAITFDIKSFFDNLDHKYLKKKWRAIIQSGNDLPTDHYNVFKNITKFSYIPEKHIFNHFKNGIIVSQKNSKDIKKAKIKKIVHLKNKNAIAYCFTKDIKTIRNLNLIKSNKKLIEDENKFRQKGIPQGSPISATLANIYMLDFDSMANNLLKSIYGIYRRYSDDMVAICSIEDEKNVIKEFTKYIKEIKLEIQNSKTQIFHFKYDNNNSRHYCYEKNINTGKLINNNNNFEYLGFQFDGLYTRIKNSSISNYYRKMKKTFARSNYYTYHNKTATKGQIFKNRLYKKFTYLGAHRRRIYQRHPKISNKFIETTKYDWGNFLSYTNLAMNTISQNKIKNQIKNHWLIFHKSMENIKNENRK